MKFDLLIKYIFDKTFRNRVNSVMSAISNNTDVSSVKKEIKSRLEKRVSELMDISSFLNRIPGSSLVLGKVNNLINELKNDLKDLN